MADFAAHFSTLFFDLMQKVKNDEESDWVLKQIGQRLNVNYFLHRLNVAVRELRIDSMHYRYICFLPE